MLHARVARRASGQNRAQGIFPGGLPNISAKVKGKKVYDPRDGLTKYTTNAALIQRDYLLMPKEDGGVGAEADEIDEDSFIEAANICDENVPSAL